MKKIENTFAVTGFLGKDAEIRQFTNTSVARFSLAVSRQEKNGEETNRGFRLYEYRGMAQKREYRVVRHPDQRHYAHRRGLLQAGRME